MRTRLVIYNITSSYSVMLGPFLILIFNAACNIQLYNLTQASCCDVNAVKALITIWLGKMSHYRYPTHSVLLSQGKYSLQHKTKSHKGVLIITQLAHTELYVKCQVTQMVHICEEQFKKKKSELQQKNFLKFIPWQAPVPTLSKTWNQFIVLFNEIMNLFIGIISFV